MKEIHPDLRSLIHYVKMRLAIRQIHRQQGEQNN